MKKSWLKRKAPLRSSKTPSLKRSRLRVAGKSDASTLKREIQGLLRQIVILRDGGCILRTKRCCGGVLGASGVVFQADHLIERSNSATYADSRLVVCVCKNCHGWKHFKKSNHDQYNELVRQLLSKERIELWDKCEKDSWRPVRIGAYDWQMWIVILRRELAELESQV